METNNTNFDIDNMTFEQAFGYIKQMKDLLCLTHIADTLGINRSMFSGAVNGTSYKGRNKTIVIPAKHRQKIIDYIKSIQLSNVMQNGYNPDTYYK